MNRKKSRTTLRTPHSKNRCNFQFADGRRCRMLRHHTTGELCLFHNRELLQLQSAAEIGAELLALGADFNHPIRINFVLGKLFAHVATGRMHRRDASTLAYIAQLLLQTLDQKRYDLARDQYDYRGWSAAVDLKYGRPKPTKRTARTSRQQAPAAPSSTPPDSPETLLSRLASSLNSAAPVPRQAVPTTIPPNAENADAIRAKYPPPANPEVPEALPDTPCLRQLVLDRRAAAAANHHANQQPDPPARL